MEGGHCTAQICPSQQLPWMHLIQHHFTQTQITGRRPGHAGSRAGARPRGMRSFRDAPTYSSSMSAPSDMSSSLSDSSDMEATLALRLTRLPSFTATFGFRPFPPKPAIAASSATWQRSKSFQLDPNGGIQVPQLERRSPRILGQITRFDHCQGRCSTR